MSKRESAPFFVDRERDGIEWRLWMREPFRFVGRFDTQAEAIDYAHRSWPWWMGSL